MEIVEKDVKLVCDNVQDLFFSNSILLEIPAPVFICGKQHYLKQAISMVNTTTYCGCLSVGGTPLNPATCFLETM